MGLTTASSSCGEVAAKESEIKIVRLQLHQLVVARQLQWKHYSSSRVGAGRGCNSSRRVL